MDELTLLRGMRNDIGSAPATTLARNRRKVMATVGAAPTAPTEIPGQPAGTTVRPFMIRRRLVLASAAAVFLVGVMVAADVVLPSHPGATAEAVEVLDDAAAATLKTSNPLVSPGQYLKIETLELTGSSFVGDDGRQLSWQETTAAQIYVPADLEGEWVWNREDRFPIDSASPEAKAAAAMLRDSRRTEGPGLIVGIHRAPGGAFYGQAQTILGSPLTDTSELPRDPQKLLDHIYDFTKGQGKTPDLRAFGAIAESLRTGVVPADLRASLFQAAALIPGVVVADRQATIGGREGIAVGITTPDGSNRNDLLFDPSTGLMIGERWVLLVDVPDTSAGTVTEWSSVRTSVVDSAP
ncbi:hypothetical protein ABIB35_003568 [Arthrobacter sp. UYP6]|uniref:CU044_5270 family protein n=1 Tax=Arthrobacter sp. UYP6 TaxID=1756378 RepID=UPI003392138B